MSPSRASLVAVLALGVCGAPGPAMAGWPNDPGVNVRVAPSASNQWLFLSVEDGAGGAFIIWNESNDVFAQHLTAQGLVAPGWPSGGEAVCAASGAQYPTSAVADGAGGFIVVWDDYRGADADVYAQRVTAAGTPVWAVNGVPVCVATDTQANGRVCSDRAGGAIFVWQDWRDFALNSFDIYAQRISSSGAQLWAASGQPVCAVAGIQEQAAIVSDGTVGGAYFVWRDERAGNGDLYGSRLDGSGFLRNGWNANGNVVCGVAGNQSLPAMVGDGTFGAVVAWVDERNASIDIYALRMAPDGPSTPGWTSGGLALTSDASYQYWPALASDGTGGTIVAWLDQRAGNGDIYAQRISGSGAIAWAASGIPVTSAPGDQYFPKVVSDGAGGAVVGWQDARAGLPPMVYAQHVTNAGVPAQGFAADGNAIATAHWVQELAACSDGAGGAIFVWQDNAVPQAGYAQRIDRWGYLGAQARIVSVEDVPSDQGGRVKVSWDRSPIDAYPGNDIASYLVYRSVPPQLALDALARGAAVLDEAGAMGAAGIARQGGPARHAFVTSELAGATYYWEYLATVAAGQLDGYSYLAGTAQDSVAGSNPMTLFMVRAQDLAGTRFWLSDPDSGYSTDDLAPVAPSPFAGIYSAGATLLHWGANTETDFASYRLYRGATAGFVPGPASLIASPPDTGYVDPGPAGSFYKLTAVDVHGNESPVSLLSPSGTVDVPSPGVAMPLALAPAMPNPSSGVTVCRFTLPADGVVRVSVHDVAGRLLRVLLDARMPAGEHLVTWEGTSGAGGRVPSGVYLERLSFEGRTLTRKILRVE